MIKICDKSHLKPLVFLFENSTKSPCYPDIWKKSGRSHREILNGQNSSWRLVLTGVSEGLILGLILGLFFWSTSIMSTKMATVTDKKESVNILNDDLELISK